LIERNRGGTHLGDEFAADTAACTAVAARVSRAKIKPSQPTRLPLQVPYLAALRSTPLGAAAMFFDSISSLVKTPAKTQQPSLNKAMLAVAVASFVIGVVVRVLAAHNDLWFDEIWSLELVRQRAHSLGDVFINVKHSNNHHLCSLWMWLVGQNASSFVYRLPFVLASIGTIVVAGLIGLRQSRVEACIAVILTSWCTC
jgi:hypothetical protein